MNRRAPRSIGSSRRRAFTLVESLAVVVVLSVAIPPAVSMMADSARAQADSVTMTRATWFATALLEQIIADVSSDSAGLGFAALADSDAYLTTPGAGFEARNGPLIAYYATLGLTHSVLIGELSDAGGTVVGDTDEDIFRTVTASVTWTTLKGDSRTLAIGCVVTDL
jgi:prepilin-type N-terminal cleavage/methylation domain-containing protein